MIEQTIFLNSADQNPIKLLNEREVSTLIRKSVHWLRRKRWEGGNHSIPYRKLGASVRYAESDVLGWIIERAPQISTSQDVILRR
jgi:predicted DNA-binding transcriptional regulator AlpA